MYLSEASAVAYIADIVDCCEPYFAPEVEPADSSDSSLSDAVVNGEGSALISECEYDGSG